MLSMPHSQYIINEQIMRVLPLDAIVMHPLPRVDEIAPEVGVSCHDPRAFNSPAASSHPPRCMVLAGGRRPQGRVLPPGSERPLHPHGAAQDLNARRERR